MRISSKHTLYLKKLFNSNKEYFKGVSYYTKGILNDASHYINLFQFIFGEIIKIKNDIIFSLQYPYLLKKKVINPYLEMKKNYLKKNSVPF